MKTIVSFDSPSHPIPDYETETTPGKDVMEEIGAGLSKRGFALEFREPIEGEGGWSLWLDAQGFTFSIFLNIAGLGRTRQVQWVVGVNRSGLMSWLPSKKRIVAMQSVCNAIDHVLRNEMNCAAIKWFDHAEFERALLGTERSRQGTS